MKVLVSVFSGLLIGLSAPFAILLIAQEPELNLIPIEKLDETPLPDPAIGDQIAEHLSQNMVDVTLVVTDNCTWCDKMKESLASIPWVRVKTVHGDAAKWPAMDYNGKRWYGYLPPDVLEATLKEYGPKEPPKISVGSVSIGRTTKWLFSKLQKSGGSTVVDTGSGKLTIPPDVQFRLSSDAGKLVLTFNSEKKPVFSYGLLSATITGVEITQELATLRLLGWPDMTAKVVE